MKNHLPRPPIGLKSRLTCPTNNYLGQQCLFALLSKKRSKKELTKRPPFLVKSLV